MIFGLLFVSLLAAAAASTGYQGVKPLEFAPGKLYRYDYSAQLLTGIPELAQQYSGFEMKATVALQCNSAGDEVYMRMDDIKVVHSADHVPSNYQEDQELMNRWNRQYKNELTRPVVFKHSKGEVIDFQAEQSEPEWSLNIKKSIISLFNLNLTPSQVMQAHPQGNLIPKAVSSEDLKYFAIYEQGMGGECETTYEINQPQEQQQQQQPQQQLQQEQQYVLNVTKTRNYKNCRSQPTLVKENFDQRGCAQICQNQRSFAAVKGYYPVPERQEHPENVLCPCGEELDASPVDQFNHVHYNMTRSGSGYIIESLVSEGKVVYNTFGDKIMVMTRQQAQLKNTIRRDAAFSQIKNPITHVQLSYQMPKPTATQQQQQNGQKISLDIPFMTLYGQPQLPQLIQNLPQLFDTLTQEIINADQVQSSQDSMHRVVEIVNTLSVMPTDALQVVYTEIADAGRQQSASEKQKMIRKLFLDALTLCGSNPCAQHIQRLIVSDVVSSHEAKDLIEAVPQNMYQPHVQTIQAYQELCQHQTVASRPVLQTSCYIAFGKLVKSGCAKVHQQNSVQTPVERDYSGEQQGQQESRENMDYESNNSQQQQQQQQSQGRTRLMQEIQRRQQQQQRSQSWESQDSEICSKSDLKRYVATATQFLVRANTFNKKISAIECLAHMAVPEVLQALEPYVTRSASYKQSPGYTIQQDDDIEEERSFLQTSAIYALAHVAKVYPKQVLPLILPVYRNTAEKYETRIAAFTIAMMCGPEIHVLESIATDLHREPQKEVRSFVTSAFKSLGNMTSPCLQNLAQAAAAASEYAPQQGKQSKSQFMSQDYYDVKRQFGLRTIAEWIGDNKSPARAGYLSVGKSSGPFHDDLLEIGFSAKGLEKIAKRIFARNGIIASALQNLEEVRQQDRQQVQNRQVQQVVQELNQKLGLKSGRMVDETPKVNAFFKHFERTSVYALDQQQMEELAQEAQQTIRKWAQQLVQGYKGSFVKLLMPSSMYRVVPSEVGVPVVISHKHPIVLSLKINSAKLELTSQAKFEAEIKPQIMYSSYTFVFAVTPANRVAYGTHVEKTTCASLPMKLKIGLERSNSQWTVAVIPKVPHQVISHKSQAKTFISRTRIASAPTQQWLADSQIIRCQETSHKAEKKIALKHLTGVQKDQQKGLSIRIDLDSEQKWNKEMPWATKSAKKFGIVSALVENVRNSGLQNRDLKVNLETEGEDQEYEVEYTFKYRWISDEETGNDSDDSDESSASNESDSDNSSMNKSGRKSAKNHEGHKQESNSSETSEESDSESTNASKSNSGSDSSDSSSESASKSASRPYHHKNKSSDSSSSEESESSPESSSSSSSESDEEDFFHENMKRITPHLIKKTRKFWEWAWDNESQDYNNQSQQKTIQGNNDYESVDYDSRKNIQEQQQQQQQQQPQQSGCHQMRTEYVVRGDKVCFTTRPVLTCLQGCVAQSLKQASYDFHCLPKTSQFTQQLMREAEKGHLKQLVNKRVDFREQLPVAQACQVSA